MDHTIHLTLDGLRFLLETSNLSQLSRELSIPYNTLKAYRLGNVKLENMPYHLIDKLTNYGNNDDSYSNFIVPKGTFNHTVEEDVRNMVYALSQYHTRCLNYSNPFELITIPITNTQLMSQYFDLLTMVSIGLGIKIQFILEHDIEDLDTLTTLMANSRIVIPQIVQNTQSPEFEFPTLPVIYQILYELATHPSDFNEYLIQSIDYTHYQNQMTYTEALEQLVHDAHAPIDIRKLYDQLFVGGQNA